MPTLCVTNDDSARSETGNRVFNIVNVVPKALGQPAVN